MRSASRVHIIGGPGTGKSTLAGLLESRLGLPAYNLDAVAYEGPEFLPRPPDLSAQRAREIADEGEWISEGIFVGWIDPLLQRADVIVWLDYLSWRRAAVRIVGRTLRGALEGVKMHRGRARFLRFSDYRRNLGQLIAVLSESRDFWSGEKGGRYPVTRVQVEEALAVHASKLVRISSDSELRSFWREVEKLPAR